jgi:hypothetical protein
MSVNSWTAFQVSCSTLTDRLALVTAESLSRFRSWFFVDLPALDGPGNFMLEFGFPERDQNVERFSTLTQAVSPMCLEPTLFPGRAIPKSFPALLAVHSKRAVNILCLLRKQGRTRASWLLVSRELGNIFATLFPHPQRRKTAFQWYADWLSNVREGLTVAPAPAAGKMVWFTEASAPAQPSALARRLAEEASQLSQIAKCVCGYSSYTKEDLLICWASRLAHLQAVRLRGPGDPFQLSQEIALAREMGSGQGPNKVTVFILDGGRCSVAWGSDSRWTRNNVSGSKRKIVC